MSSGSLIFSLMLLKALSSDCNYLLNWMLPALTVTIMWTIKYTCFHRFNTLTGSVKFAEWTNKPNNGFIYGHICDYFSAQSWLLWTTHWDFYLFVYALADDENYKEGQVTFLCTNFIRKSYENLFTVGSALTPSSLGLNDRTELPGDWQVTERQCHATPPLLSLPESLKQMTSADGTWEDKLHGAWEKPAQLRLYTFSSVLEKIFTKTWPTQLLPCSTQVMYLQ